MNRTANSTHTATDRHAVSAAHHHTPRSCIQPRTRVEVFSDRWDTVDAVREHAERAGLGDRVVVHHALAMALIAAA